MIFHIYVMLRQLRFTWSSDGHSASYINVSNFRAKSTFLGIFQLKMFCSWTSSAKQPLYFFIYSSITLYAYYCINLNSVFTDFLSLFSIGNYQGNSKNLSK